ncbi:MAG: hypothetical protein FWE62_01550, partial [Firmicutes bacterium]|nr:hypothetical protein [Bacillota bacterium]
RSEDQKRRAQIDDQAQRYAVIDFSRPCLHRFENVFPAPKTQAFAILKPPQMRRLGSPPLALLLAKRAVASNRAAHLTATVVRSAPRSYFDE